MQRQTEHQVDVICHSGYTYAERPLEVHHGGKIYQIARVLSESRTPQEKRFQVVTEDGLTFMLIYHFADDCWSVPELTSIDKTN